MSVYVVSTSDGFLKIGASANPLARLAQLQGGNHLKLSLLRALDVEADGVDAYEFEGLMHQALAPYRVRGEWFDADFDLVQIMLDRVHIMLAHGDVLERWRRRFAPDSGAFPNYERRAAAKAKPKDPAPDK